jgi:hypothetical protein
VGREGKGGRMDRAQGMDSMTALAILLSLPIAWDIARTLLRSWRPWPEPRAHHRFRCGGGCAFSHDDAELFAKHVEGQHHDDDRGAEVRRVG